MTDRTQNTSNIPEFEATAEEEAPCSRVQVVVVAVISGPPG